MYDSSPFACLKSKKNHSIISRPSTHARPRHILELPRSDMGSGWAAGIKTVPEWEAAYARCLEDLRL